MYFKKIVLLLAVVLITFVQGKEAEPCVTASDYVDYSCEKTPSNTYDFIVVGVGQTGSVVAGRLVEAGYKVLGIEGGVATHASLGGIDYVAARWRTNPDGTYSVIQPPLTRFDVPQLYTTAYLSPSPYGDWPFYLNGVLGDSTIGKLLGGSAAHNGMIWLRHTKPMMDAWNISGWSYNDCLPFFKKSESVNGSAEAAFPEYHGFNGPITITDTPYVNNPYYSAVPILLSACNATGLPINPDFNGPTRLGCGTHVFSIGRGIRASAANAYLPQAIATGRLTLSLVSEVTKVLIKPGSAANPQPVAYGVEYIYNKTATRRVFVDKEVIITGSAILTPKILMLSGVGDAAVLKKFGIKVWANSTSVGKNLKVNQLIFGSWTWPSAVYPNGLKASQALLQYAINGSGPWSHPGQYTYAYSCSNTTVSKCTEPDFMIGTAVGGFSTTVSEVNTISTQVSSAQPKVIGSVSLWSSNYTDPPNVTMDTFGFQADVTAMVAGIKLLRKILNGTICQAANFTTEIQPGPTVQNDTEIANYIKANGVAGFHWVGTSKMGNFTDTTNVVDTTMKVIGISGLRIGDTSVLPTVTTHLQASAAMVAERCADFIIKTYAT